MKYANPIGSKTVLTLGEREIAEGKVTVKDMMSGNKRRLRYLSFWTVPNETQAMGYNGIR
jgi:histidyl-tRNA synthetase